MRTCSDVKLLTRGPSISSAKRYGRTRRLLLLVLMVLVMLVLVLELEMKAFKEGSARGTIH